MIGNNYYLTIILKVFSINEKTFLFSLYFFNEVGLAESVVT